MCISITTKNSLDLSDCLRGRLFTTESSITVYSHYGAVVAPIHIVALYCNLYLRITVVSVKSQIVNARHCLATVRFSPSVP